jgi:biopolymer transport protein ExbB
MPNRWMVLPGIVLLLAWALAMPESAWSQEGGDGPLAGEMAMPADEEAEVASTTSLLDVYRQGGWMMHVLLLCSIGTIAVVVYCFVQVSAKKMAPGGLMDSMNRLMANKDVENAYSLTQENPSAFSRVVGAALLKVNFERDQANKASMEAAAGETLDQEETRQMLWVNYLNVFATIAPMIGLLGTVMGMMQAFGDLSAGKSQASDLAGGINKAMGTTAGGLLVGIPAMFFYFFFRNKLTAIVSLIQRNATFAVDVLSGEVQLAGQETGSESAGEAGEQE